MATGAPGGRLVWSDEFDAPAGLPPNPEYWRHETGGHGWGNGEQQIYTASPDNAFHDGQGHLVIRALATDQGLTSARLTTKGLVEIAYGRLECRARLPGGSGLWSAFWALGGNIDDVPWPACGEIDVFENLGGEPMRVFGTAHCPGHAGKDGISGELVTDHTLHGGFHVFAVDWLADRIVWRLDGRAYHEVTRAGLATSWVFDHPFYLLLNLAIGGWLGGAVGSATTFPADLTLDYVRVYALDAAETARAPGRA